MQHTGWKHVTAAPGTTAIGAWLVTTTLYTCWAGRLLSPITVLMVFPGIFVALYLSLAGCLLALLLPWQAATGSGRRGVVLGGLASLAGSVLVLRWLHALM